MRIVAQELFNLAKSGKDSGSQTALGHNSTTEETQTFSVSFTVTGTDAVQVAAFSDDGVTVHWEDVGTGSTGTALDRKGIGQPLNNLNKSLHTLGKSFDPGHSYRLTIEYENTFYTGVADVDGVTLIAFGGEVGDFEIDVFAEYTAITSPSLGEDCINVLTISAFGNPSEQLQLSFGVGGTTESISFVGQKAISLAWLSTGTETALVTLEGQHGRATEEFLIPEIVGSPSSGQFASGNGFTPSDAQAWMTESKDRIGFAPGQPVDVVSRNREITTAYAEMFLAEPYQFYWSGMAAFASDEVGKGMKQAQALRDEAGNPILAIGLFITWAPTGTELLHALGVGNLVVYADMYWQHLAFREDGVGATDNLFTSGKIAARQRDAWRDISAGIMNGDVNKKWTGNSELLAYEQSVVLETSVYNSYGEALDYTSAFITSPIPGDSLSFRDIVPGGDISDFNDRWHWITASMLPAYITLYNTSFIGLKNKLAALPSE